MKKTLLAALLTGQALAQPGLHFERIEEQKRPVPTPVARTTPLSPTLLQHLLSRLPELHSQSEDVQNFAINQTAPPAGAGQRIEQPFPAPAAVPRPTVEKRPLEIVSYSPQGEVPSADQVSITFNQPMQPERLAKITPEVAGEWRWLGSQTLLFQPQKPFPMASQFQVELKGQKPLLWSFATPAPELSASYPNWDQKTRLQPVLFLKFNQRMDKARCLPWIRVDGVPVRLASAAEIAADEKVQELVDSAEAETWLAVVPSEPLPRGQQCTVTIAAGLTSREGPRPTTEPQQFRFQTYPTLALKSDRLSSEPGEWLYIGFSNALKEQLVEVKANPEIPDLRARVRHGSLWVWGKTHARTHYELTLPAGIRDMFGQQTDGPITLDWNMEPSKPSFKPPEKQFLLLDPDGPEQLPFGVINHEKLRVQLRSVQPSDWHAYQAGPGAGYIENVKLPGELVFDQEIETGAPEDEVKNVFVDLSPAFKKGPQALVSVRAVDAEPYERPYYGWVQRTQLGANVAADAQGLLVWVNQLRDGTPIAGAKVHYLGDKTVAATTAEGLTTLPPEGYEALVIESGGDQLLWPITGKRGGPPEDSLCWFVNDDRKIYKPGERVSIKGWLRREIHQPQGGIQFPRETSLSYVLKSGDGTELARGQTAIERLGSFQFQVDLPSAAAFGYGVLTLKAGKHEHEHDFRIDDFRRPEFDTSARTSSSNTVMGGIGSFTVEGSYFAGGGLKAAPVTWKVSASPGNYNPPHWEGYTFGSWRPWWDTFGWLDGPRVNKTFSGTTDQRGEHTLDLKFLSADEPRPYTVEANATLLDLNRQSWTSGCSMRVHPAAVYVGIKADRNFVAQGQSVDYQLVVTDVDGKVVSGRPVELKILQDGDKKREIQTRQLTSQAQPLSLNLPFSEGGSYQIEATVQDENNRSNRTALTTWVSGGPSARASQSVELEELTLVPDKEKYQPGEVAKILILSPFSEGYALATSERHGVASRQVVPIHQGSATVQIPLNEDYLPNLLLTIDAVGRASRGANLPDRPAQARAGANLQISTLSREIQVTLRPERSKALPGTPNRLEVDLRNSRGRPLANCDVALLGVDEAVLALAFRDFENPLGAFYSKRPAEVKHDGIRQWLHLALSEELEPRLRTGLETIGLGYSGGGTGVLRPGVTGSISLQPGPFEIIGNRLSGIGKFEGAQAVVGAKAYPIDIGPTSGPSKEIRLRQDFSAVAFYLANGRSDAAGRIRLPFKLPDNLTRYRLVALAAAGETMFGEGESSLTAQQPLMVRPSPPRFLNLGDRCELPVLVQNQTDKPLTVQLACRAVNLRVDPDRAGVQVTVPANDRVEVRFPISAERAGKGRLQFAVSSGNFADAASAEIPVLTPATGEAMASYGTIDQGAVTQPVIPPQNVYPDYGGLEVSTSSTALSELTDAFLYLRKYPYECSEQISSRVLGTIALEPVLRAFQAKDLPAPEEIVSSLREDIEKLELLQNSDGGWDFWRCGNTSVPYVSLHVAHALVRARQAGHKVSDKVYDRALDYARRVEMVIPDFYPERCRPPLRAYALDLLCRAGKPDVGKARALLEDLGGVEKTEPECLGWLLPTLSREPEAGEIRRQLDNRVRQTNSTADFATDYGPGDYLVLASERRDDAVILAALLQDSPESELAPKLVRGLLSQRRAGRWESTQENCLVLLALHDFFQKFERATPEFVARLWLGGRFGGEQAFRGRSTETREMRVPIGDLSATTDLLLSKEGEGRLYYRVGMKYAPRDLRLDALDRGFTVERKYEATEDNRDVRRDTQGAWHIKAGARVKVTVAMVATGTRYQVALVDPLPAGLESINPALQGAQQAPEPNRRDWWNPRWYDHDNLRDDRAEAFTSRLHSGPHSYTYYARATTPGHFTAPPAKAEEMYHPETFGRCASDRVIVEP